MSDSMVTGSGSSTDGKPAAASSGQNGSRPPVADVKELGGQLVSAARNGANSLYEEQRDRAAGEIAALGEALERSAGALDGAIGQALAPYAQSAARQVGDFAGTMRNRSLSQLGGDIEGFARQWPMAFMAASIGLGFVAGRFLLSSGASISDVVSGTAGAASSSGMTQATQNQSGQGQSGQGQSGQGQNATANSLQSTSETKSSPQRAGYAANSRPGQDAKSGAERH